MKKNKITDTEVSKRLDIPLSTINVWKKTKVKLYEHIIKGFITEMEQEELRAKADKYDKLKKIIEE